MEEIEPGSDDDRVDPRRLALLGLWTMALAIAFTVLLIGDNVSATTF